MPVTSIDKPSYLILDNCVLSMLTEWYCTDKWYCEENRRLSPGQVLPRAQQWLIEQLTLIRSYSSDNLLHTTSHVSREYLPRNGVLGSRGLTENQLKSMTEEIQKQFDLFESDNAFIQSLRTLPGINRRLANPRDGLSNPDLSLIHLGLHLTQFGSTVVILSNDQDLLEFVSWIRIQPSLRVNSTEPALLHGENGLGYLELIHRSCRITTDQMSKMINFTMIDTVGRMQPRADGTQLNPQKAMKIYQRLGTINDLFTQAVEIKAQNRRVAA